MHVNAHVVHRMPGTQNSCSIEFSIYKVSDPCFCKQLFLFTCNNVKVRLLRTFIHQSDPLFSYFSLCLNPKENKISVYDNYIRNQNTCKYLTGVDKPFKPLFMI